MTTKDAFSDEEWVRVRRAPFVAGMVISLADPGGPFEMAKETMATLRSATSPPTREQLLAEVALELQAMAQQKDNPLSGFTVDKDSQPGIQVLAELREVSGIVAAKATTEESGAFRAWLVATAQAAADAAKEGGFMGFGAVQVSEREQTVLQQLRFELERT